MITAKDAKINVLNSDSRIDILMSAIFHKIEELSNKGISLILLDRAFPYFKEFEVSNINFSNRNFNCQSLTNFQAKIKTKLEAVGFAFSVISEQHDGRGGFGNMDEFPTQFKTYHIRVSW
jgi:hypothetical protein